MKHMPITSGENARRCAEIAEQYGIPMFTVALIADYVTGHLDEMPAPAVERAA